MAVFYFRVRGRGAEGLHPRAPVGPWLEIEAASFEDARRELAMLSSATGFTYESRATLEEGD